MSILDKLKDPPSQPAPRSGAAPGPRPRMPDAVSAAREVARIGDTIKIHGDVTGAENLVVDCRIEGTVSLTGHDLTIGQNGYVSAGVSANVIRVEGAIAGNVTGTEKVIVTRTGRVLGDIVAPRVSLEDGARFKGAIDMDPGPAPAESEPTSPQRHAAAPGAAATHAGDTAAGKD